MDQSQTAIEVSFVGDDPEIKRIHAKSIHTLARSLSASSATANPASNSAPNSASNPEVTEPETGDRPADDNSESSQNASDAQDADPPVADRSESEQSSEPPRSQEIEVPPEPEYNAWEVWTYLERQRLKTLKLLNTFQAEWEANRFVREAERNTPPNLRVHYEIRPVVLDESVINAANAASHEPTEAPKPDDTTTYADAIDVEVIG